MSLARLAVLAALAALAAPAAAQATPDPVLLVVAQRDFYAPDLLPLRDALHAEGVPTRIASATLDAAVAHDGTLAQPDVTLADADASDYSALAFIGGWGAASFAERFDGTFPAYEPAPGAGALVADFLAQDKRVAALCFGVAALAWADLDGHSPLAGRTVAGYPGGGPGFVRDGDAHADAAVSTRWHVESNGAEMTEDGAIGNPQVAEDDVIVDGPFVTAQDFRAAPELGRRLARLVLDELAPVPVVPQPRRVLLVIANRDFWWREYAEPREELEARGIEVEVAAGTSATCLPHAGSGAPDGVGAVQPDMTIAEALQDPARWDAVAIVGGWGASAYQPTYEGTYADPAYNGDAALRRDVGDLLSAMHDAGRWVTALCHGVSVLASADDGGQSLIAGRTVVAWPHWAPAEVADDGTTFQRLTREHVEASGAVMLPTHSVGDPLSPFDDVVVDGPFITGESFDSAREFGRVLAGRVLEGPPAP